MYFLIFCIRNALILAALIVFFDTDQNPLDCTAARSRLIHHKLIGQAVEETRFHESWTICRWKKVGPASLYLKPKAFSPLVQLTVSPVLVSDASNEEEKWNR